MITLTLDEQVALLTKDLSGRLPYKVIINYPHTSYISGIPNTRENAVLTGIDPLRREYSIGSKYTRTSGLHIVLRGKILIKPCLRPLSDMTPEEKKEISDALNDFQPIGPTCGPHRIAQEAVAADWLISFMYEHHLDFNGLIKYGLAIDVTTLEDNPYNDEFIY